MYVCMYVKFEVTEAIVEVTEAEYLKVPTIHPLIFTPNPVAAVAATAAGGRCCGFLGLFETVICRGQPAGTIVSGI